MKPNSLLLTLVYALGFLQGQENLSAEEPLNAPWTKEETKTLRPATITPPGHTTDAKPGAPPSDAIVFFDGTDLSKWKRTGKVKQPEAVNESSDKALWTVKDGYMEVGKGVGWVETRKGIEGDTQWHIEWRTPNEVVGQGQGRGNSGVFLTGYPEVQVLDSYRNDTYPDGQASGLYKRSAPLVNASRKPGQWQTYDIICVREKKDAKGNVTQPGSITVLHNGIVTQFAVKAGGSPPATTLKLQDHNNPVRFRNIWARKLVAPPVAASPEAIKAAEEKEAEAEAKKAAARKKAQASAGADTLHGLPLVFSEDFENGHARWEVTDAETWTHRKIKSNHVFGINARKNSYKPPHRSPYHIALIKDFALSDFAMTFRVRSTNDTGNHRDCCVFFNHQDPQNFYYVHLGAKPDPHSGQIMIVKDAPRLAITKNEKLTPWTSAWHQVKVVRDSKKGTIEIYFDDMETPHMTATDKTFGKGRIGIGSFDDMNDFDDIRIYGK